jgi:amino acid adenylation domain-containing protein
VKSSSETLATQEPSAPLSPSQEGLWFLHQVEPGSSAYHNVLALRFEGPLQVGVLQRSLTEICRRHEALRTRITVLDGVPRQVATPAADLPLPVVDAVAGPDGDLLGAAVRQAREEAARPFDLAAGPAIRALLLRLAADDWLLLVTVHHVVSDGTGVTILLRELVTLYPAYLAGEPSPLPDPPVGYLAAANRRSERLAGRLADGLAYWTDRLAGAPPLLELPLDRPRPLVQRFRGGSVPVELPRELTDAVREFSRREGVTVYMTFLAALQLLLHRYTGQQDILVGSQMTGRTRRELRDMVAYLVNTIVLRTEVEPELTVRQLLARARETAVGAFRHSDIPFEKVVASLRPPRSRGHHPVFQVVLSYHERGDGWLHASSFTIPTLTVSFPRLDVGASRFDLSVCVHEGGDDTLGIDFEYDSDLFDLSTVERMAGHFQQLLAGMVAAPDTPVRQLPLLTDRERELLLTEWGRGPAITPSATCLHQPFEAQATRTPTAVALAHGGEQVTYAELDRRANQLAHHLRRLGAGPGQLVGVCLRRSPELVVGLLGVLKSGAGYVFFEPSLPLERREFMIKDSAARIVLAEEATAAAVPGGVDVVVSLDAERAALDREPTGRPAEGASGDDLAYCIYTSGSTGTPKAVGIRHAGCVSFLDWAATVFEPADLAGVLASSSPMFDCPLFEVFVPLSWGGTAVLAGSLLDLPRLAGPVPVTLLMGAPTVVAQLLVGGGIPDSVRAIDLSGEAMPSDLPAQIYRSTAVQRVFNYYGISEMTTHTIGTLVPRPAAGGEDGPATMAPTIGRPIGNATVYVLDETMNPVPVGVTGELYVGGAGVARGYLGRPALTADRFLADPFGPPGARLYRSGDLARYRPDGTIEYLGRSDRQVKLRGFRVELGEVESLLGQFPGVDRAAVVLREDEPGRRRLVGYLVPAAGARPAPADVRAFLRERLPEHAVPTAFVLVDQVPVTANGKIAVAELPRPEYEAPGSVELWRLADAIETQVRMIWNDVLGTGAVEFDARATFFDLGGDSLQAVVMLGRVQEVFGVDVPIGQFMAASTIEDLSTAIRAEGWRMPPSCVVKVFGDGDQRPFFCIHPGGGELYELRYLQKEFGERPVYALMPVGWNGEAEPLASIEEMAIRYVEEVRRIQPRGPYLLAGLSLAGLIAFDMAQRFRAAGEEVAFLGLFETWPVLDGAVCLPEDAYEYQSTAEAQEIAARTGQVVIPAQELLYMKRLSPAIPALEELERGLEQRKIHDFDGLCRELAEMRAGLQAALDQLKARGLVVNELDMAAFYRMHEVAAKQIWAKSAYRPRPYPGTAVLFAGPSAELPLLTRVWTALVAELAVDQIDEEVHTELLRDPRLARALRVRIEEAESRLRPAPAGPPAAGAGTGEVD